MNVYNVYSQANAIQLLVWFAILMAILIRGSK